MNLPCKQVFDLFFVIGVEKVRVGKAVVAKPDAEAFPNRDNLGVVGHRTDDQRFGVRTQGTASSTSGSPRRLRPTKSRSASVVGAITLAARASRKRRSMPNSLRKAAPPQTFMPRS